MGRVYLMAQDEDENIIGEFALEGYDYFGLVKWVLNKLDITKENE